MKILVVDDEAVMRNLLKRLLERKGFAVTVVESGKEALGRVQSELFDLVFLDVVMPKPDGLEVLKRLKKLRPEARVVMMTGYSVEEKVSAAVSAGAFDCLYKPFNFMDIEKIITRLEKEKPVGASRNR